MWKTRKIKPAEPLPTEQLCARAAAYCSLSEHCPYEVEEKLRQWGADVEQVELIICYLEEENYLSEQRYVEAYVHDKLHIQGWGRQKISMMLAAKRVDKTLVREALEAIREEEYLAVLARVAEQKRHSLRGEDEEQLKAKLYRYLMGRGFTYGEIQQVEPMNN